MTFALGAKSMRELAGVEPRMVRVVQRAIVLSTQDFTVFDGLRTTQDQQRMVASGASETMDSKHLPQPDGYGHAVDLVPWINGKPRWEWGPIFHIASAMHTAAREMGLPLRWGGVWDRPFLALDGTPQGLAAAVEAYVARRRKLGKKRVFIDGPHYEIARAP